jgi:hypothetical protein
MAFITGSPISSVHVAQPGLCGMMALFKVRMFGSSFVEAGLRYGNDDSPYTRFVSFDIADTSWSTVAQLKGVTCSLLSFFRRFFFNKEETVFSAAETTGHFGERL